MNIITIFVITFLQTIVPGIFASTCGYDSCDPGKPGIVNVHLIAHTHDDVGWLKTVDQYFYGYRDNIQTAGVQYILDTVIASLWENPARKFSYVEMAYFYRWWNEKDENTKAKVVKLVNDGRLQFLLGGWSMNDEATTHYTAIIDQMALGLNFLNQTFGECGRPLVSWQIDPFGHSIEQANLFAQMSFDALFFWRLDYRDKQQRLNEKRMEFLQRGSFHEFKDTTELFTSILYDSYCTPPGFCFDGLCNDDPIMNDPTLHDYNVEKRVNDFANYVLKQAQAYQTNHILIPMGCDFQFQNAFHNFVNLDKLIYYVNKIRKDINVIYSTPACYTLAVNKAHKSFTVKRDDFFPYASGPNSFWTGYFTSRSSLKGFVQQSNQAFQVCKQVHAISQLSRKDLNQKVNFMAMKMGVLQHHDGVSGTEKQQVTFDYEQRLNNGLKSCEGVINSSLSQIISNEKVNYDLVMCNLRNISYCDVSDNIPYGVPLNILVYNSHGRSQDNWHNVPVQVLPGDSYTITKDNGTVINFQLVPITNRTKNIPERPKTSVANYNLVFHSIIPPIGYSSFTIKRVKSSHRNPRRSSIKRISIKDSFEISNNFLKLTYSNGLLNNIFNIRSQMGVNVSIDLRYYLSFQDDGQKSGAYIFRPTTNQSIPFTQSPTVSIVKGNLVTEIHQTFADWATMVTRLYNNSDRLEVEWTVGPIPIDDKRGKEVVVHYATDLNSENNFFTDSNARQTITRCINQRFDYKFNQTEPVAGNMYPVNSHVFLVDINGNKNRAFTVHVDRAQGAGAYENKMLEILVHRRTLFDDNFGVGEPLNESGSDGNGLIIRGKHWVSVDYLSNTLENLREINLKIFNRPLMMFSRRHDQWKIDDFSAIVSEFPVGINLLSLQNHYNLNDEIDYQIIRLENVLDLPGKILEIDLTKIFKFATVTNIEELNLSANQYLKNVKRLQWNGKFDYHTNTIRDSKIILLPGAIRTFKINLRPLS